MCFIKHITNLKFSSFLERKKVHFYLIKYSNIVYFSLIKYLNFQSLVFRILQLLYQKYLAY